MTNFTKTALIGAALLGVAFGAWGLFAGGKTNARVEGASQGTPSAEMGRVADGARDKTQSSSAAPLALTDDADFQLLGQLAAKFPAESRSLFKQAVRTAGCIEIEKRKFDAKTSHGRTLLEGLRRKLFIDDFEYAALLTGKIDKSEAKPFYNLVASQLEKMPDEELLKRGYGAAANSMETPSVESGKAGGGNQPPEKVAQLFRKHYALIFTGSAIGYSEILQALRQHTDQDVLASDLFLDASIYVGVQTEIIDCVKQEKKENRAMDRQLLSQVKNPTERTNIAQRSKLLEEAGNGLYAGIPEALKRIFEYRLRERYQLNPAVLTSLDTCTLRQAGPELRIPTE